MSLIFSKRLEIPVHVSESILTVLETKTRFLQSKDSHTHYFPKIETNKNYSTNVIMI